MSSVVAEASSQFSSQPARPKSGGQGGASASDNGFSGLVDDNLAASRAGEVPEQPGHSARDGGTQGGRRTGVHARPQDQADARPAEAPARDARTSESSTTEIAAAPEAAIVIRTGVVTADRTAEPIETAGDAETNDVPAASSGTAVVAAVTVPLQLATDTAPQSVIDSNDAVAVSNPPATIVAAPAETAANALARVAGDIGENQTSASGETGTPAKPDASSAPVTTDAAPAPEELTAAAASAETAADASAEVSVDVETAAPDAQVAAKASTELSAVAKVTDPAKPAAEAQQIRLTSPAELKPVETPENVAAPEPAAGKADADRRVETRAGDAHPNHAAEANARSAERASHDPAQSSAHKSSAASEQAQPQSTGFVVSHAATQQASSHAIQAPQLTAVPVANGAVPINGVAVQIAANVQIGRSRFEIRLDPPELGRIDVRLDLDRQGQVTSHLIVEKPATLDLLRRDAQQLERALQDAGLKTSDNGLQFSLRDQQQQHRNDDNASQRNVHRLIVTEEETVAAETAGRSYGRMIGQRGGIDIRV